MMVEKMEKTRVKKMAAYLAEHWVARLAASMAALMDLWWVVWTVD